MEYTEAVENYSSKKPLTYFKSHNDGTCILIIDDSSEDELKIPELSPEGEKVVAVELKTRTTFKKIFIPKTLKSISFISAPCYEAEIDPQNPYFSVFDGVVFDKGMNTLIYCPLEKTGKFIAPASVRTIKDGAFSYEDCNLHEVIFQEGLEKVEEQCSLYGPKIVTLPASVKILNEEAFEGWHYMMSAFAIIRAPQNSYAHSFAVKKGFQFMPSDCNITWDSENWLKKFNDENADYRKLRQEVWENTKAIVQDNGYSLSDEKSVILLHSLASRKKSSFYCRPFIACFEPLTAPTEITVIPDDCLDIAHKWVNEGLEVCVLNMANRQNPGGGVTKGAGAQEEYLFRCSDYYKFLFRHAPYAGAYGLIRSRYQYPLDQNFGGIYSPDICIFRENEKSGYKLAESPWKVNMIAVAGMNSPALIFENRKERIAPELVEGVKNKIRTIFRIACDHGQRNLVLGALGCGAFHNPPEHVAELFRDVLREQEFSGAFLKICFAVKTDHNSKGETNYLAFKKVLHGFVPKAEIKSETGNLMLNVKKIVIGRDFYAILKETGEVFTVDINTGKSRQSRRFKGCRDIAAGFNHLIGLCGNSVVRFKSMGSQAPYYHDINWYGGVALAACEGHSAMLKKNGSVVCSDHIRIQKSHHFDHSSILELLPYTVSLEIPKYSSVIEALSNVAQVVLTFDEPYALTQDGNFWSRSAKINDFFNDGRKITQIAAFGCYYSQMTVAALYADGKVKALYGFPYDYDVIKEVEAWNNVKKICCGSHAAVTALTNSGKVLLPQELPYKDKNDNPVTEIDDVVDIAANFEHFIALTRTGKIIYLRDN